ncbi:SNF2 family N-terminal domain-containing protein [Xylariales sp. PMI_506]|nr:SNF2 family N-terminal domain-containing protein [Xylariales sp. PMI_506]
MTLILRDDYGLIWSKSRENQKGDGLNIGILNKLVFRGLQNILKPRSTKCDDKKCVRQHFTIKAASEDKKDEERYCGSIRHDVWISVDEWNQRIDEHKKLPPYSRKIVRIMANMNLFGPRSIRDEIAKELGQAQLFLQKPYSGSYSGQYDNPQIIDLSHLKPVDLQIASSLTDVQAGQNESHPTSLTDIDSETEDTVLDIDQLFNELPMHISLDKVAIAEDKFCTSLKDHQLQAVDFIFRRESGESYPERTLWRPWSLTDGTFCKEHIITGTISKEAEDCLGGILADDMGLGKTLSMLAAIVHTIDLANIFHNSDTTTTNVNDEIRNVKGTLIVVPSELLMDTWTNEIGRHISTGCISVAKFHGQRKRDIEQQLHMYDVIITTYSTMMAEQRRVNAALQKIRWYRLVLDEAHTIRNWSSKQFQAISLIQSHIRWCITGTPIQNSLDDLGALVRFLKVPIFSEPTLFRKFMSYSKPNKKSLEPKFRNLGLLLGSICLRRNKSILPNIEYLIEDRHPVFTADERQQYRNLETVFDRLLNFEIKKTSAMQSSKGVMESFLRLRMFCNNGINRANEGNVGSHESFKRPDEILSILQQCNEAMCWYCTSDVTSLSGTLDDYEGASLTTCLHVVCRECTPDYRTTFCETSPPTCPICEEPHGIDYRWTTTSEASLSELKVDSYPSKILSLLNDIEMHHEEAKCVVFSFWKTTLDITEQALKSRNIEFIRVDGSMTPKARGKALKNFHERTTSRVLLITFSTGAAGLNDLTVAHRIHILEPQWNPAVEDQAIGRVLRIDQDRQVVVIRYTMQHSIEEIVQKRKSHKLLLARGGFTNHRESDLRQMQHLQNALHAVDKAYVDHQ